MDPLWIAAVVIGLSVTMALVVQFFTGCGFWAKPVATEQPGPTVNWAHVREMELDLEGLAFHDIQGNLLDEPLTRAEVESVAHANVVQPRAAVILPNYARAAEIRQQGMDELEEITPQYISNMTMREFADLRVKWVWTPAREGASSDDHY